MAAAQSSPPDGPPYPSLKEFQGVRVYRFSAALDRLHWPLTGAFPSVISVMRTARDVSELDPFFQPDDNGGTWHEIASLPVTDPKVSSIEASLPQLDEWQWDWLEWHQENNHPTAEYVTYGDLSDEDRPYASEPDEDGNWEADSDTEFILRCCGEDRPLHKKGFKIKVTPSADNHFVTIRDYISAVHPWLMGLRADILQAMTVARSTPRVASEESADTEWMVGTRTAPENEVMTKSVWLERYGPRRPIDATTLRILQRIGARIAQ